MPLGVKSKLTLVHRILDALSSNMMSLFSIPAKGSEDHIKYHLVKWEELLVRKRGGRLNIKELSTQNKRLMMKWSWKRIPSTRSNSSRIIDKTGVEADFEKEPK
ncbi:hypothetical protein H5410_001409 [Solanum commersonii]|uniref:Uncharacterized protein n=1 Tax=Solanum commersonii TaxID=4109 RepID=A0A9J6AZ28_SOLCO|nr:hypothetical protein H5410_001409 [Solanum commersonii]